MRKKWYWLVCAAVPLAVGGLAAWITAGGFELYQTLRLPPLSPPGWVFPLVWTVLYLAIGPASGLVIASGAPSGQVLAALKLYALQLGVNFLWPILFFSLQLYFLSFLWILLLALLAGLLVPVFYRILPLAGYLMVPYLLWLVFAAYLNFGVYLLN